MRKINSIWIYSLLLPFAASLFANCSNLTVLTADSKTRIKAPPKRTPPYSRVPATQRPYKINGKKYYPIPSSHGFIQEGIASWYGKKFHGRKTSNGEVYDMYGETAAHKTLPMHTRLLVENLENGKEVIVRINDRGPFVKGRIIDLSLTSAKKLDFIKKGTARVRITALGEALVFKKGEESFERFAPHEDFSAGEFYVQIGSFTDKKNADNLKNKMLSWGKKTVIKTFEEEGKKFYRVQVRAGKNLRYANRMERALGASGFPGAFVVAR